MPTPSLTQLTTLLPNLIRYLGARMFVGFTAVAGLLTGLYLLGHDDITLPTTVAVAAIVTLGSVAAIAIIGRTITDRYGTMPDGQAVVAAPDPAPNNPQPPHDPPSHNDPNTIPG